MENLCRKHDLAEPVEPVVPDDFTFQAILFNMFIVSLQLFNVMPGCIAITDNC